jgi:alkylation response protein AidB-like acyl-CoA dehydrogenase
MAVADIVNGALLNRLAGLAEDADRLADWPAESWNLVGEAGGLRWSIPSEFGGEGLGPVAIAQRYEALAASCLTSAFILSQRDAAVRRLLAYDQPHLKSRFLPALARGDAFMTVGLSQLTTSRQHGAPSLTATPLGNGGYRLDGESPWVTGADQAEAIVIGATLPDLKQMLFVLPRDRHGVTIGQPLEIAALRGSRTSFVRCAGVELEREWVLAGPADQVLGKGGGGGLDTSTLALGLASAAIEYLRSESNSRKHLEPMVARFEKVQRQVRQCLHHLAAESGSVAETLSLRVDATRLALRATQTALIVSKGMGFVSPHPAQRWARQALFFLVWSCPRPAAEGILSELTPPE